MRRASLAYFFLIATIGCSYAEEREFAPPSSGSMAALLQFAGPVSLNLRIASEEDLGRIPIGKGVPLASFAYSDSEHSSDRIIVSIYAAGEYLGSKRSGLEVWVAKELPKDEKAGTQFGIFQSKDGRSIYQFPLGFGPGGSAYGTLLSCRDSRYELVLVQSTNFHDEEDGKGYSHHVAPTKDLRFVIESVELLLFP